MSELIDDDQISMLVEGAGVDAVRPILDAYWESNDELTAELETHMAASDAPAIATTAHGLKGSSANLGALKVAARAKEIEFAAKDNDLDKVRSAYAELAGDIAATREAFDAILAAKG